MKIITKIIICSTFSCLACQATAIVQPPITNSEIKAHADHLLDQQLYKVAKKYYSELYKRNNQDLDSIWNLALIDILENNHHQSLAKLDFLLNHEKVNKNAIYKLKSDVLIYLAKKELSKNNFTKTKSYLKAVNSIKQKTTYQSKQAKTIEAKLENINTIKKVNIGVILPISGKLSKIGTQLQHSLKMALLENNIKGITLIFEDNKSTQDGSLQAATKLLNYNPKLIIGPVLRDNVLSANSLLKNTNIPMLAFSNDQTIAKGNIFLNNINIKQEAQEIANFAINDQRFRLACITADNPFGKSLQDSFSNEIVRLGAALESCENFKSSATDITQALKKLLQINRIEAENKATLKKLEKEYKLLGNAMDDEKIEKMELLKQEGIDYSINFNALYVPVSANKIPVIAPQLAFYDIDFSSGVMFLGGTSWDDLSILKNRGEHLHFSRFLSLKGNKFKNFETRFEKLYGYFPNLLAGFAYDTINIIKQLNFKQNINQQLKNNDGFSVLTGNVKFNRLNLPERIYGVSKISRRKIIAVKPLEHIRPIQIPSKRSIVRSNGFGEWFGF